MNGERELKQVVTIRYDKRHQLVMIPILLAAEIIACAKKASQASCDRMPDDPILLDFHRHLQGIWEGILSTGDLPEFLQMPWEKV